MKNLIVIQTDFSTSWSAVASMKGVMKMVDEDLEIIDLDHDIEPFNILEASRELHYTERFWPKGTIFVSVVDPGVGTDRRACCALLNDGNYVITPDNGSLSHVSRNVGIKEVREIDEKINRYKPKEEVSVFHGRDLFGYCAAKLASNKITFEEVGPLYSTSEIVILPELNYKNTLIEGYVLGFVSSASKHYGNCVFSFKGSDFRNCGFRLNDKVKVLIKYHDKVLFNNTILFTDHFNNVNKSEALLYEGSDGYMDIALNQDHFTNKYGIGSGLDYVVEVTKDE